jgi:hypothetical protein
VIDLMIFSLQKSLKMGLKCTWRWNLHVCYGTVTDLLFDLSLQPCILSEIVNFDGLFDGFLKASKFILHNFKLRSEVFDGPLSIVELRIFLHASDGVLDDLLALKEVLGLAQLLYFAHVVQPIAALVAVHLVVMRAVGLPLIVSSFVLTDVSIRMKINTQALGWCYLSFSLWILVSDMQIK